VVVDLTSAAVLVGVVGVLAVVAALVAARRGARFAGWHVRAARLRSQRAGVPQGAALAASPRCCCRPSARLVQRHASVAERGAAVVQAALAAEVVDAPLRRARGPVG